MPQISVLMPTYNNGCYLADAIESILNQTFSDLEFFIFDDGSTDNTAAVLDYYSVRDNRIKIFRSKTNYGRGEARNRLLFAKPKGDFVAIMDSDDIAMSDRFEKQIMFLRDNPDIAILGTQVININENGNPTTNQTKLPTTHGLLAWCLIYSVPFCNPSVMLRSTTINKVGLYKADSAVEDADYWARAIFYGRFSNLPEVLLQYRMPEKRLIHRMSDWDVPLRQVSIEFIKKVVDIKIGLDTIALIRQSMYQSVSHNLSNMQRCETVLILQKVFSNMVEKRLIIESDKDELLEPIMHQVKSILGNDGNE